ncbi:hypothetical protein HQ584_09330 [Patescibacteria group bacterium]|nr:hypothetical protein [Patescibacteria group bacterium]
MDYDEKGLFSWEEGAKHKRMGNLPERTNLKCKVRSKPKVEGQEYLDLYLMTKEKERLERFGEVVGKMEKQTAKNWTEVKRGIAEAENTLPSAEERGIETKRKVKKIRKRTPKKPMKTIPLNY